MTTTREKLADLQDRLGQAVTAGSARAVERQHAKGKLTARERVEAFCDPGSFVETGALTRHRCHEFGLQDSRPYGDGVVTGQGTVDGRDVCVFAHDFTVFGGSLGEVFGEKVIAIMDRALKVGCPIVGLNDSGGARIQEGVVSLAYYAEIGMRNTLASGVVPQLSLILGPCAGGAVYSPAITDFTVMVDGTSHMFVTGPEVVAQTTGERISAEELGGARVTCETGNAHYLAADEKDALEWTRALLSFLPQNNRSTPPVYDCLPVAGITAADRDLDTLIPDRDNRLYDMRRVLHTVLDDGDLLEVGELFGRSIIVGFGRIEGHSVGVVANQPMVRGGALDIDASEKAARFVRFCDAFGIPVVTFADVPGYLPGSEQERLGIIRRGAKLIYAYAEATVPKLTVVTRKAYGGGYAVMGSKHLGADINLAWPTAQIAVMGAEGAVQVLHRRTLAQAAEQGRAEEVRDRLLAEYRERFATPYLAAERGYVDRVIHPHRTRLELARALRMLRGKRSPGPARVHGNIPL
jgi:propionyl-CoA carboxylase beta chain